MSFTVSEAAEWVLQYRNIWNEVESQLFKKLVTGPIKGEGTYIHGNLKTWRDRIKTNFHGQEILYDMYCNATAVLKIDSVYKQSKNYHPQVYVEECNYTGAESQHCNMLSDADDGFFEVWKERIKTFVTWLRVIKLIIYEQDVAIKKSKGVKYTPSKLYENKKKLEEAIKDTITKYKEIIFGPDSPVCMACLNELRKKQLIGEKVYDQKLMYDTLRKLAWDKLQKNIAMDDNMMIDRRTGEVLGPNWFDVLEKQALRVDFMVFVYYKITYCRVEELHVLNGTDTLDTWSICDFS